MRNEGTVVKEHLGRYFVQTNESLTVCSLSSMLRKRLVYPTADPASVRPHVVSVEEIKAVDPVAIGDKVRFEPAGDGTGVIKEVLPRRTKLSRRAGGSKPLEHVLVANVDQIVPVFAAKSPSPKLRMLDRFLVAGEREGLEAVLCMNKMDLVDEKAFRREMGGYERIGYRVIYTSALEGSGLEDFKDALRDKRSILVGPSGVGKSSLLNAVQPGLGLKVREISRSTGKGKHTTTHLELLNLDFGGMIVDTPGLREFGLWGMEKDRLAHLFPEMRGHIGRCKFGLGCTHSHEPGCAIKKAAASGEIDERRYDSYVRLLKSL